MSRLSLAMHHMLTTPSVLCHNSGPDSDADLHNWQPVGHPQVHQATLQGLQQHTQVSHSILSQAALWPAIVLTSGIFSTRPQGVHQ